MKNIPSEGLFNQIIEFLAGGPTSEEIAAYQPPGELQARLDALQEKNRQGNLSSEEQQELAQFLSLNRFMSRLKIRARQRAKSV
jgi:hypothetical protein